MEILKVIQRYGETTYTIAKKMEIKQSSISNMINGNPTIETLRKLAKAIGCSVAEFFIDELSDDFDMSSYRQPKQEEKPAEAAPGVVVCPHCGAGISFTAVVTSIPKAAESTSEEKKEGE